MKLMWFSHFVPFPPRGGNLQRSFNLVRQAARSYEIHLFALNLHGESFQQLRIYEAELRQYCESVAICELPFRWRGGRWWAEAMFSPLFNVPFSCRALFSKPILARWNELLRRHPGALVHFDSIDLALYASATQGFRRVLNHHNCESEMAHRRAAQEPKRLRRTYLRAQADKLAMLERSLCADFDLNFAVSERDKNLLRANAPAARIHIVENGVDTQYFRPTDVQEEPHSLVFTGSMDWYPNVSGLRFFVREVWPDVKRRFPDVRIYLAGRNPPEEILRWPKQDPGIVVIANPDDIRPFMARAAVYACPMLEGGGTRLKILDAMAAAKPVISTTTGCEGLRLKAGENIMIADTPRDFAEAIAQLFESQSLRRHLALRGRALVEHEYSWERIGIQLEQGYGCVLHSEMCGGRRESIAGTPLSRKA